MIIRVEVTREHIRLGLPKKGNRCALAMAGCDDVLLRKPTLKYKGMEYTVYVGPLEEWLLNFDLGKPVQPFTLLLDTEKLTASMEPKREVKVEDCVVCEGTGKVEVIAEKGVQGALVTR